MVSPVLIRYYKKTGDSISVRRIAIAFERISGAHDGDERWIRTMTAPEVKRLCIATGDPFEISIIQRVHDVLISRMVR